MLVSIMVDSHHQSASEANEGDGWLKRTAVGPKVHDADLGLSRSVGGLDDRFKRDALLKKIEVTVGDGDRVEVFVGRSELNPFACKGVEGF